MPCLKVYSWTKLYNYGDALSVGLLNHYGKAYGLSFKAVSSARGSHLIGIGSLLDSVPVDFPGDIWSTGGFGTKPRRLLKARVWCVRGLHSSRTYDARASLLGDCGLLVSRVFKRGPVHGKIGIVANHVDLPFVKQWMQRWGPDDFVVISVHDSLRKVSHQIAGCRFVFASSLHGLVVADSYRVPNARALFPTSSRILGGNFKYNDYYSSLGMVVFPQPTHITKATTAQCLRSAAERLSASYQRPTVPLKISKLETMTHSMLRSLAARYS